MDINLGEGIDGTEAAERILRIRDIPVVFLSSHTEPEVVEKTEGITSYGYIVKNSGDTVLLTSIKMAFRLFEAKRNDERFRHIMDSMQDVVFTLDREKRHTGVYGHWVALNGSTPDFFLGKTFEEILGPEGAVVHNRAFERALAGEFTVYEWSLSTEVGARHFQTSLSPIVESDGTVSGIVGIGRDTTELQLVREALEDRGRLMSQLLKQVPGAIYQYQYFPDGSSRFPFASENIYLVYEVTPEEVQTDASKVFGRIHPEDFDRVVETIRDSGETLKVWKCDYRVNLPERGVRWLRGQATPEGLADGSVLWHGYITDITDLKRAETALRETEERWQFALDGADHAVWDWNPAKGEVYFSPRWKSILGHAEEEIGPDIWEWESRIHPEDKARVFEVLERHLAGETPVYETEHRLRCKDGSYKWILDRGKVFARDADGKPQRAIGTHTDISDRKAAEERINKLAADKDTLLKEVHHRIKNNFATVESLLSLQASGATHPETVALLRQAESRIAGMRMLYEKLLSSEHYRSVSSRDYLEDLGRSVFAAYASGEGPGVRLETEIDAIEIDTKKVFPLGAILTELVTNSLKYAFDPGEEGTVRVRFAVTDGNGYLVVADTGKGLPPDLEPRTTQSFGLMLVKLMAEQTGGELSVESTPGAGTRVTVRVPMEEAGGEG
jgi:PAS domain S-box-containing protein